MPEDGRRVFCFHALSNSLRPNPSLVCGPLQAPPNRVLAAGDSLVVTLFPLGSAWGLHRRSRKCAVPGPLPCSETRPRGCFLDSPHPQPQLWSWLKCGFLPFILQQRELQPPRGWRAGGLWGKGEGSPAPSPFSVRTQSCCPLHICLAT